MEPVPDGPVALVLASYNRLQHEIQALVAENRELTRVVGQLRGQQRHGRREQQDRGPASAPPVISAPHGHFPFPNTVPVQNCQTVPADRGLPFQYSARDQEGVWHRILPSVGSDISSGLITQSSGRSFPMVPSLSGSSQLTSYPFSTFSSTGSRPQVPPQDVPVPPQDVTVPETLMPEMSSFGLRLSHFQSSVSGVPRNASWMLAGLDQPLTSTPGGAQQQTWEQLVGEVAFQLDRCILARVFPDRPRVYGFTVANSPEKIMAISLGAVPGAMAEQWASAAAQRYVGVMRQLQALGYSPSVHPAFAESLVNTYGILSDHGRLATNHDPAFLRQVVTDMVPAEAQAKAMVLLECLQELARDDGQPLFC